MSSVNETPNEVSYTDQDVEDVGLKQLPKLASDFSQFYHSLYSEGALKGIQKTISDTDDAVQSQMIHLDETLAIVQTFAATRSSLCEPEGVVDTLNEKAARLNHIFSKIDALEAMVKEYEKALCLLEARADEIKDTIPDESIKAKVGSLFSSLFSTTQTQQSNQVTQSKSGAHPKISAWGGEDLVPNSADFLDL